MKLRIARDLNNTLSLFSDKPKLKFINIHGKRLWIGDFVAAVKVDSVVIFKSDITGLNIY